MMPAGGSRTTTVSGAHDPTETIPVNNTRHAECGDCHNSHSTYAQSGTAAPPSIQASMTNISGYDTAGVNDPAKALPLAHRSFSST